LALVRSDDKGWSEENVIAVGAINGALGRVREDVSFNCGLTNFLRDGGFLGKRFARGFVFYEFDGLEEAEAADLTDIRMGFESGQGFTESFTGGCSAIEEFVGFEEIEDGVACGGGNGM
jgi:hypothetical protein